VPAHRRAEAGRPALTIVARAAVLVGAADRSEVWALTGEFSLTNVAGRAVRIQSPAGVGRAGAGFN
jgi:hypothetical protein